MMDVSREQEAFFSFCPTTNNGTQNGSSVGIYTHCVFARLCTFGVDLYAQSVLINKFSASKLSWKFIKSALLVGCERRGKKSQPAGRSNG